MNLTYGSVCSGIEAASEAWQPLGWQALWVAEIEAFPSAVLAHRHPGVSNEGDMTMLPLKVALGDIPAPDVLVGGTPCQSFSIAGMRAGLSDSRGQLTLKYVELANEIDIARIAEGKPECIAVWENVPGVLSSSDNAFGCFLAALAGEDDPYPQPRGKAWAKCGVVFGPQRAVAWRVLDAQHFGVAQRRRRVFVVASARTGFHPAQVLLEFNGVRRDSAPSREARKGLTCAAAAGTDVGRGDGRGTVAWGGNNTSGPIDVATAVNAHGGTGRLDFESETFIQSVAGTLGTQVGGGYGGRDAHNDKLIPTVTHPLRAEGFDAIEDGTGRGTPLIAFHHNAQPMQVRRLTPRECERLQGFRDDYTNIPWRGKPADQCPDGPRYKALGNSMAVPCMRFLGQRIEYGLTNAWFVASDDL